MHYLLTLIHLFHYSSLCTREAISNIFCPMTSAQRTRSSKGYLQPTLGCLNLQMPWWTLVDIKCGNEFLRTFAGHVCMSHCLILKHIAAFNKNSLLTIWLHFTTDICLIMFDVLSFLHNSPSFFRSTEGFFLIRAEHQSPSEPPYRSAWLEPAMKKIKVVSHSAPVAYQSMNIMNETSGECKKM